MTKKELEILLSRVEGIKSLLESNSLEQFQQEVLKVENYLKRFGSCIFRRIPVQHFR